MKEGRELREPASLAGNENGSEQRPHALDQVRELLFGEEVRRTDAAQTRLGEAIDKLRAELQGDLGQRFKESSAALSALTAKLATERERAEAASAKQAKRLDKADAELGQRLSALTDQLEQNRAELDQRLTHEFDTLRAELRETRTQLEEAAHKRWARWEFGPEEGAAIAQALGQLATRFKDAGTQPVT